MLCEYRVLETFKCDFRIKQRLCRKVANMFARFQHYITCHFLLGFPIFIIM